MKVNICAWGYTSVILAMNMRRFVSQDERNDFETLRGKREFANVLRTKQAEDFINHRNFTYSCNQDRLVICRNNIPCSLEALNCFVEASGNYCFYKGGTYFRCFIQDK